MFSSLKLENGLKNRLAQNVASIKHEFVELLVIFYSLKCFTSKMKKNANTRNNNCKVAKDSRM